MAKELNAVMLKRGLKTNVIGRKILYLPSVASTMDIAHNEALKGALEGTIVIAGKQTRGRGRLKRGWLSPEGNIALSIVLYPDIESLPYLIMIASLAVVRSIESVTGIKVSIKWPNDILISGKKVCGILIENELRGSKEVCSIVGIGINIALTINDYPEIADTAISLESKTVKSNLNLKIIRSLIKEFDRLYLKLPEGKSIYEAWRKRLITLGKQVRAISGRQTIEGIAEEVDEDGTLMIRKNDGELTKIVAGDVTLRGK